MFKLKKVGKYLQKNKKVIVISVVSSALTVLLLISTALLVSGTHIAPLFSYKNTADGGTSASREPGLDQEASRSAIVDIVGQANSAVVSIVVSKDVPVIERYYQEYDPFGGGNPFGDFFGFRTPQYREKGTERKEVGGGSGFFVSPHGLIITNKHVVEDEDAEYTVLTNDGKKYEAEVLAKDAALDIAVLKIAEQAPSFLEFGDSDSLKPGQTVIAIGNALAEFRNSVSVGVVSGLSRSIVAGDLSGNTELLEGVIQTDAAINPGNSGGPLLNLAGHVVGVNVAMQRGAENIGFAIPSNTVESIVRSVKEHGEIVRPYLGVRYTQITEGIKEKNNLPVDYGALIIRGESPGELAVIPGSPADKAGIVENDIILEIDGEKIEQGKSLALIIRQKNVGQTVKLKVLHDGEEKEADVRLERAPESL